MNLHFLRTQGLFASLLPCARVCRVLVLVGTAASLSACAPALSTRPAGPASSVPPPRERVVASPPAPAPEGLTRAPATQPPAVVTYALPPAVSPIPAPTPFAPILPEGTSPPAATPPAVTTGSLEPAPQFAPTVPAATPPGPVTIALVLPLESPTFGRAAEAVAAGFKAAAEAANAQVIVIPHGDNDVLKAFDKAEQAGAGVIVGPLLRDDVKALATAGGALPWTIALNQVDEDVRLPDHVYTLALSIEGEARQIARAMRTDGVHDVAIVADDSPLQRRFAASFTSEWILQGGGPPSSYRLPRTPDGMGELRKELARAPVDAILLAAGPDAAALVRPYLPQTAVYASSQINDRQPPEVLNDLDAIRFVDLPWLADPDAPNLAGIPRRDWPNAALDRLYALGYDSLQVALAFEHGPPDKLEMEGATGHLTLEPNRQIAREGRLMRFESGHVVADDRH